MNWLEQHSDGLCKLTGIMLSLFVLFYIWATYDLGMIPKNSINSWTPYQWYLVQFFWVDTLIDAAFYMLLAILCFRRMYFVFPCIVIFIGQRLEYHYHSVESITQVFQYDSIRHTAGIASILCILAFALAIIGTLLFTKRVIKRWA